MTHADVERIVDAVLYEGYVLYPYRASTIKNRQRFMFGGLFPRAYVSAQGGDPASLQLECLLCGAPTAPLDVRIRFLHILTRQAFALSEPQLEVDTDDARFQPVDALDVDGQRYVSWQEATERQVHMEVSQVDILVRTEIDEHFAFGADRSVELIRDHRGLAVGALARTHESVSGLVRLAATCITDEVWRVKIEVVNDTPVAEPGAMSRNEAQRHALASTHAILGTRDARFISLTEPPEELAAAAAQCRNDGIWPVLVGDRARSDQLLASPIILYDFPEIAAESHGDLYDATEIDEILSLRVRAMTDDEKREVAAVDERTRRLLERTDALSAGELDALHGRLGTGPRLHHLCAGGRELRVGDRVRLHPRPRGDVLDLALVDKLAVIESIERDFEDQVHVAVALDDDPGRDLGLARMPGHRFFFTPEEIEIVSGETR